MECKAWVATGLLATLLWGCSRSDAPPAAGTPPVSAAPPGASPAPPTDDNPHRVAGASNPTGRPAAVPTTGNPPAGKYPADVLKHAERLASAEEAQRRDAERFFADRGDSRQLLMDLMTHPTVEVRRGATFGLLARNRGTDIELRAAFMARLADEDEQIRHIALQAVSDLSDEQTGEAVPQLVKLLDATQEEPAIRARVARILGSARQHAHAALPALLDALANDPEKNVRLAALASVYHVAEAAEEVVPATLAVLKSDPDPTLRKLAIVRISAYGPMAAPFLPQLDAALDDPEGTVRSAAAKALTKVGPAALPVLLARSGGESRLNRVLAIDAIGAMGRKAESAKPELEKLLTDQDTAVSQAARVALGKISMP